VEHRADLLRLLYCQLMRALRYRSHAVLASTRSALLHSMKLRREKDTKNLLLGEKLGKYLLIEY